MCTLSEGASERHAGEDRYFNAKGAPRLSYSGTSSRLQGQRHDKRESAHAYARAREKYDGESITISQCMTTREAKQLENGVGGGDRDSRTHEANFENMLPDMCCQNGALPAFLATVLA